MRFPSGAHSGGRWRLRAVTLIELLVVVAVIGVLLSLLLPSLRGARARAGNALCAGNLRSVGMVMADYAAAHNERNAPAIGDLDMYWDQEPRIGWDITPGLWARVPGGPGTIWRCATAGGARVANYCAVGVDNRYRPIGGGVYYVPRSWWRDPANLVVAYDPQRELLVEPYPMARAGEPMGGDVSDEATFWDEPKTDPIRVYGPSLGPHDEAWGALFGDGHAEVRVFPEDGPSIIWVGPRWWQ